MPRRFMPLVLTCLFLGGCIGTAFGLSVDTIAPNGTAEQIDRKSVV